MIREKLHLYTIAETRRRLAKGLHLNIVLCVSGEVNEKYVRLCKEQVKPANPARDIERQSRLLSVEPNLSHELQQSAISVELEASQPSQHQGVLDLVSDVYVLINRLTKPVWG